MLYAIVALLVIILDQWTKLWVTTNIQPPVTAWELIPGTLSLVNVHNNGAAFSFLAGKNATMIFIGIAVAVALLVIIALATNLVKGGLGRWSLVFIAAGGLSNCIDRIMADGYVQDMIKLDFLEKFRINFPIFNVADIFITLFCFLFILYVLFGGKKKARYEDEDEEYEDEEEEEELEDEEEEEEEDDRPLRRRERKARKERKERPEPEEAPARPRKARQAAYEEDYERYKARKAREAVAEAPAERPAPPVDPGDPFAEWDKANQKAAAAQPAPVAEEAPRPAVQEAPRSAVQEAPRPAVQEAPRPAVQEAPKPVVQEAPKSAPAPELEEFSLEDILAEFR